MFTENKGMAAIILVIILILVGSWFLNSPKGANMRAATSAANLKAQVYPASSKTLYPVSANPGYDYYTAPSTSRAYITYPIATSTGSSYYASTNYRPTTTTTTSSSSSSYYYNQPASVYQYQQNQLPPNCYIDNYGSTVCQNAY